MTRWLLFLLAAAAGAQIEVRVLSYNIHHGEGTDARFDLPRIAAVVMSVKPDVVALQEVDVRTRRASGIDQALELARLTGMHAVFGRGIEHEGGWYGNAVLSRWPVSGFTNHPLPASPGRERRAVIEAAVDAPAPFAFWATHLDINEADRVMQAAAIREMIQRRPAAHPMILAGDLNAVEGSKPMKLLLEDWRSASLGQPLPTIPAAKPSRQIDFILYRPAEAWRVKEVRVLDEAVASDHRPIFAVLEAGKVGIP